MREKGIKVAEESLDKKLKEAELSRPDWMLALDGKRA